MIQFVPRSIRSRMALYVLILLAVLLIALSAFVYFLASGSTWGSFQDSLIAEAHSFSSMMEYGKQGHFDIEIADSALSRFEAVPGCEYYRVLDSLGRELALSRSLRSGSNIWKPTVNWIKRASLNDPAFRKIYIGEDEKLLVTLKCLPRIEGRERNHAVNPEKAAIVVQVTRSTRSVRHLLATLMTILFVGGLFTLAMASLGSRMVARIGLRPLRDLTSSVQGINENNLGLRVPQGALPQELVPLAAKTNEMLSRIEKAFQREKRFTSDASHEIRTPLSALITTLEVALRKSRSPQEYQQMIKECLSSATHLKKLADALLFLAALDAGKVHLHPRSLDLQRFLNEIAAFYREDADRKSISIRINVSVPEATIEPDLLSPVLNNLVSNAIEYCRPGDSVSISAYRRNSSVCIDVSDTGPGIAKPDLEKLFYRFYRGCEGKDASGHVGLGLAIAAKAAQAMGGRIEVESEVGKGSTFRLILS